jgi:hypothetical protein
MIASVPHWRKEVDSRQQVRRRHPETPGEQHQRRERRDDLAVLDRRDVGSAEGACRFGLGQPGVEAKAADARAESHERGGAGTEEGVFRNS